jgi:hypothetical protein
MDNNPAVMKFNEPAATGNQTLQASAGSNRTRHDNVSLIPGARDLTFLNAACVVLMLNRLAEKAEKQGSV